MTKTDNYIQIEGFSHIRLDRDANSGKTREGGVCMYIKDSRCRHFAVRDKMCKPDLELLCVTLRPHYLPREFTNLLAANAITDCPSPSCLYLEILTTAALTNHCLAFINMFNVTRETTTFLINAMAISKMPTQPEPDLS